MSTDDDMHGHEPHTEGLASRLNWLRAGVLGANDGIVSTAGIVVGVAASAAERGPVFAAGIAGLAAGAVSMALGEYVSVSTQRDTESALLEKEQWELENQPAAELAELADIYQSKGMSRATAEKAAAEVSEHDAFAAHSESELGINPHDLANPWQAAFSSAISFTAGALLPLVAILLPPESWRIPITFVTVVVALALTGAVGAYLGKSSPWRPTIRMMAGGSLAMAVTYGIGLLVGTAVG